MRIAYPPGGVPLIGYSHALYATRYVCHTICVCFISGMTDRSSHWHNQALKTLDE
jgi:hypothetical protein